MTIKRSKDNRVVKCVLHRVADIPGGVTVKVADLGGSALYEGTPLAKVSGDGLYNVVKTAQVVTEAAKGGKTVEVAKGHHFKVGDNIAIGTNAGGAITAIDKSNAVKDVITFTTATTADIKVGNVCVEAKSASEAAPRYNATAIAGSNVDVKSGDNTFVDAWVIGVVRESNAPVVNDAIKTALRGIQYV